MSSSENEDIEMNQEESSDEGEETMSQNGADSGDDEELDVNASATESDDDSDEVDDDKDIPAEKLSKKAKLSRGVVTKITEAIKSRNAKRVNKQLYIRFPEKLPEKFEDCEAMVKALSPLVTKVHKPRQKHARFCLIDFESTENRDVALKELSKNDKKIVVSLPKTDNQDFINKLIEKKIKNSEMKLAKNLLRKQNLKIGNLPREYTSTIVILNLPKTVSVSRIKELFPDSVDIQINPAKKKFKDQMVASITLPSTVDAKNNVARKLELDGTKLMIRFARTGPAKEGAVKAPKPEGKPEKPVGKPPKSAGKPKKAANGVKAPASEKKIKAEVAPSPKKAKPAPKKKPAKENGSDDAPKPKAKKPFPPHKPQPAPAASKKPAGKPAGKPKPNNKQKKGKAAK
ncbi:nucleolar protein dao-5 [Episyrphus balteatus]|uniref:nucleolar protein dao-5 n=1 Tax=Episyrphus balteatus TaxID=286459 RepID=UPI002485DDA9|nr:nucleolar protein dao-5 [Episyrphus balteatus]